MITQLQAEATIPLSIHEQATRKWSEDGHYTTINKIEKHLWHSSSIWTGQASIPNLPVFVALVQCILAEQRR